MRHMSHTEKLTRREREIMNAVFALGNRATAEAIRTRLHNPPGDSAVRVMLARLERKGALKREKFRARSIELLVSVEERQGRFVLPLLGSIQAGAPLEACEEEKTLDLASILPLSKQCFALRVQGNSMIGDQIRHGDYVIVERRSNAQNGDTVVAVLGDGRATLKRFYRERSRIRLQPANDSMKPTYVRQVEVRGVVIGLLRNFNLPERN